MAAEFRKHKQATGLLSTRGRAPVRRVGRIVSLTVLVLLVAVGLASGWMVYLTRDNGSAKAATGSASPVASQPAAAPAPATQAQADKPPAAKASQPAVASLEPPAPTKTAAPAAQPPTQTEQTPAATGLPANLPQPLGNATGPTLVYCYQGKVPDFRLLVVDKSRQRLMVLRYMGELTIEFEYPCATGMQPGNKSTAGDERTPVGIYFTTHRFEDRKITVFGDRAIHLDYPNAFDQCLDRDGHGIFLHGTDKALKTRSSNGCVVMRNEDLAVVAGLIKEQFTPIIVVESLVLPKPQERIKACEFLQRFHLANAEKNEARLGPQLATLTQNPTPSLLKELDSLAPRLAGFDMQEHKADSHINGMAVFGLGDNWVVLVDQRMQGPKREELSVARRLYLKGDDPAKGELVQGQWVVGDLNQARQLASWAPALPVAVAAAKPPAEPTQVASLNTPAPPQSDRAAPRAAAPAPANQAPVTKVATKSATPEEQLRHMVAQWVKAWEAKNVNAYISHYAADFKSQGMDREAWRKHKTYLNKVYKIIGVEAKDVRVEIVGVKARVTFTQHYRSDWHRDVGRKTLDLVLRGGHWQITGERWEALPGRAATSSSRRS